MREFVAIDNSDVCRNCVEGAVNRIAWRGCTIVAYDKARDIYVQLYHKF